MVNGPRDDEPLDWEERREIEERMAGGMVYRSLTGPTPEEVLSLIRDADALERATATLHALEKALKKELGITVVDATTDDDEGAVRLEFVQSAGGVFRAKPGKLPDPSFDLEKER